MSEYKLKGIISEIKVENDKYQIKLTGTTEYSIKYGEEVYNIVKRHMVWLYPTHGLTIKILSFFRPKIELQNRPKPFEHHTSKFYNINSLLKLKLRLDYLF